MDPFYEADSTEGYLQKYSDEMIRYMRGSAINNLAIRIQYNGVNRPVGYHRKSCPFKSDYAKPKPDYGNAPTSPQSCEYATCTGPFATDYAGPGDTMDGMNWDVNFGIICMDEGCKDNCGHAWSWPEVYLSPGSANGYPFCNKGGSGGCNSGQLNALEWWVYNDCYSYYYC